MKKQYILLLVVVAALLLGFQDLLAQPPPALPVNPEQSPIDGGLSVVALAGGAYALKKLKAKK
jgi:hypothetical protein